MLPKLVLAAHLMTTFVGERIGDLGPYVSRGRQGRMTHHIRSHASVGARLCLSIVLAVTLDGATGHEMSW